MMLLSNVNKKTASLSKERSGQLPGDTQGDIYLIRHRIKQHPAKTQL
jgi:hypothetical protein